MEEIEQFLNYKRQIYQSLYMVATQTNNKHALKHYEKCRNKIDEILEILSDTTEPCALDSVVGQSEQLRTCKYVKKIGESCRLNNNCKYPNCE